MGLDKEGIWDETEERSLLQLAFNPGKTNGAHSRDQGIFNNNWDEEMKVIKGRLFLNTKTVI